jgi:7-keto-8-aminopelargonate synthetase-like enzyme
MGLPSCPSPVPILSVTHHDEAKNQRLRALLLENGIYPPLIDYPGSPPGGHFRFTLSGLHTLEEVDRLLATIAQSCD